MRIRRPELVLAAAVAICLPMVPGILSGAISPIVALVRFLIALMICWAAGALLSNVLSRYAEEARRTQIVRMIERAREQVGADQDVAQQKRRSIQAQATAQKRSS